MAFCPTEVTDVDFCFHTSFMWKPAEAACKDWNFVSFV